MADDTTPAGTMLVNGVQLAGPLASKLSLDLSDPVAVLAVHLVADGTDKVRQRAAKRAELLKNYEAALGKTGLAADLHRPDAIATRIAKSDAELASLKKRFADAKRDVDAVKGELAEAERPYQELLTSRRLLSQLLWWLGIGYLIWRLSGKAQAFETQGKLVADLRAKVEEATRQQATIQQAAERLAKSRRVLEELQQLDGQPLELLRRFGWSHVPFETVELNRTDRLIFSSIWSANFKHTFPDIPDGLHRVELLRDELVKAVTPPILLSPTTDDTSKYQGLVGEELKLAHDMETFDELMQSAETVPIEATLLPADATIDHQLNTWSTPGRIDPSTLPWCYPPPGRTATDSILRLVRQIEAEQADPDSSLVKRLESVAVSLRHLNENFTKWRTESIESLLGAIIREWASWTALPLRRRYCPSFHRAPVYRYHKLGFKLDDAFDDEGRFLHHDKLERLPEPQPVQRKLRYYEEELADEVPAADLKPLRDEILTLIRQQVEGREITALSAAATLRYTISQNRWQCGLCVHERRIGAAGTPEQYLGCPEGGMFSEDEARMAEQYVHYEDLMKPMLSALWEEKSTRDEINRILREKEGELRRNVLEEQQALRDEARIFKEDARDRLVQLENLHGEAHELREKLSTEVRSAYAMGAVDGSRQRELLDELRDHERSLAGVGSIKSKVTQHEDYLSDDVAHTLERRQVILEEQVRRSSDAPEFVHLPPRSTFTVIGVRARPLLPAAADASPPLLIRKTGVTGGEAFGRRGLTDLASWLGERTHVHEAAQLEVNDGASSAWVPMLGYGPLRALCPHLPSVEAVRAEQAEAEPPSPPPDATDHEPPPSPPEP